ncbi:extracellular solute-binding protein [Neorhizobium galegae]|uniref:extracellular solute-binding protein n=1 Tax=Neorhizobium galegae TaxID=399 RepID=UPI000621942B|nr:extracellular solute-binding protein [Neorhizobium galegae]MCQ1765309.1 extracellular solute-binding protein [Neorhizobium galegae]MCQ1844223.1 extracellular solute-binding protein [Neorhizobium galegae]CDZ33477.1 ABC-type oligopeptide transport system, periplasmic component [Neorhizobium galegae bv. officinalis]
MGPMRRFLPLIAALLFSTPALAEPVHGVAMHGRPALGPDYKHFPYVNPDVKKGGRITYGVVGTFDSLNPFILKSMRTSARGIWDPAFGNLIFESLMTRSSDEAFTLYGLLAESVEWNDDRTFIQFNLNPKAKWSDGQPVTPDDVIFSFELLRDKARIPFSSRLAPVAKMEKVGERGVRFTFNEKADREFPLILATGTPILPKHATDPTTFDQSTLKPPVGSGPYRIKSISPGERIVYERDPGYWGKDIPAKVGFDNYDQISVEYFLQDNTLFEAFKKGAIDIYPDGSPTHWARAYDFPAVQNGDVIKDAFKPQLPTGMLGFVFNTRRALFADVNVRAGLSLAFDFEWANKNLFEGAYTRTESFWQNSPLSSLGKPADERELKILGAIKDRIEPAVLDGSYRLPKTDASGADRKVLRDAVDLLRKGGYAIKNGRMTDASGRPLTFEVMTQTQDQEKLAIAYQRTLKMIGVDMSIRTVDDAQYQARSGNFDYDMIVKSYPASLSPGIEQVGRWGSDSRNRDGSFNFAGTADPDLDKLIGTMLAVRSKEDFEAAVRAYDRMLISGHYLVPLYHIPDQWVARRKHIGYPGKLPLYGYQLNTWWDKRAQ